MRFARENKEKITYLASFGLHITEDEFNKRKSGWQAPPTSTKNAFLRKYAKLVSSASIGAITSGE